MKSKRYFFLGDIHGAVESISAIVNTIGKEELNKTDNYLFLLGDSGINFYQNIKDKILKERLGQYPFTYIVLRGNHDIRPTTLANLEKDAWDIEKVFGGNVLCETEYPYIKYLSDKVYKYKINNLSILSIPGAYSVDKHFRLHRGWVWVADEQLSNKEMNQGRKIIQKNNNKFDIVLSHTCPVKYEPTDLFLPQVDQSTVDKSMELYLEEIEESLDYKYWIWGHYHKKRIYPKNNDKQCIMLYNEPESCIELIGDKFYSITGEEI